MSDQIGSSPPKRAVAYLRVSTRQQAQRDGSPEGYSLPTQRKIVTEKAESLGAVIVDEYLDKDTGTRTDKRPDLQALLARILADQDVDYVIVFKLDRWARNAREDLANDYLLEQNGAELVSCSEPIDRSNSGRLSHVFLAGTNEYQSRNMGDEIRRKRLIKIENGGTPGPAPLGYKNVGEGGRRYVVQDPDVVPLVAWLFEAYATGDWTLVALLAEATERGLWSKGGPNTPRKVLAEGQLNRILASPYYKGIVRFNGVEYQGKHEPVVDEATWDRVQAVLESHRQGTKARQHPHYLKGTIFCGHCGSQLCITNSRSKTGKYYMYYFCVGRHQKRTTCMLKHRPLALVEEQIEDHYRLVQLTADGLRETAAAVVTELAKRQADTKDEQQRQRERLRSLDDERTKLLHAHYAGAVPLDLLKVEQERITAEMKAAQGALAKAEAGMGEIEAIVVKAVSWAENCHEAYLAAGPQLRKQMNQAFFSQIMVTEEGVVGWEYQQPFDVLMRIHPPLPGVVGTSQGLSETGAEAALRWSLTGVVGTEPTAIGGRQHRPTKANSPSWWARAGFVGLSSKDEHLAEREGFEPSNLSVAGFQDRCIRPLCHRSARHRRRLAGWSDSGGERTLRAV